MQSEVKVSVRELSKAFPRQQRNKIRGISTDGLSALIYLLKQTFRSVQVDSLPSSSDKNYFFALDGISFDVYAGEVLGIIGRNGAGKSTLLKILARVMNPSAGSVSLHGRVVSMLELGIGFAPDLTVRENIQIQGRLAGIPSKQINESEDRILDFSGLADYRDVQLGACPSGSAVQLGFAAMVNFKVDVILADEVLAVGDSRFRQACEERVRAAGKSGESVLFVSHDMNAVRRICTRVVWIDRGKIVRIGATDEVVNTYTAELMSGSLLPPITQEGLAASCLLLDLRLLDADHAQIGALQINEPGYIDCLFRILRPDVTVTIQIELWNDKNLILTNSTHSSIKARESTTFHVGLKINADFLNEAQYEARCRIFVTALADNNAIPIITAEERLSFSVMNPHPNQSVWAGWAWGRNGMISPRLSWTATTERGFKK